MDSTERSSVRKILCKAWPFMSLREMEQQPPFGVRVRNLARTIEAIRRGR